MMSVTAWTEREYQTVYASNNGAVAAPTAGFHFTDVLLKKTEQKGADLSFVTLHVGTWDIPANKRMRP